tara:strand:- start:1965 stop:4976 length:3012 start_codon:yes stop_codon:yes gene_type:complete
MAFLDGHFNQYGQTCINSLGGSERFWFPDGSSWIYDEISFWYNVYFGRYAEEGGANYWYQGFTSPNNNFVDGGNAANSTYNTSLQTFIFNGGAQERAAVASNGRHTGMSTGDCPILGCTNPQATNYNSNATQDDGSCILPSGCTDPQAYNYDSSAITDDGTCQYYAPQIIFNTNPSTIVAGSSSNVSWYCVNPTTSFGFVSGTISSTNQSGNQTVIPSDTSTYCAQAFGPGGGSGTTCVTVNVLQVPTCSLTLPGLINYAEPTYDIGYATQYATSGITITPTYNYLDGSTFVGNPINITPLASSAELGGSSSATDRNGTVSVSVPWTTKGPSSILVNIAVNGAAPASDSGTFQVVIDQTPANFSIPESPDKIRLEDPVISPETTVTTQKILIDDIDIPVEIHADFPILVDKNSEDNWQGVRQTGTSGVGGSSTPNENEGLISSNSNHPLIRKIAALDDPIADFQFNGSNEFSPELFTNWNDPNAEPPFIAKISNSQLAQLINCISLIDEVSPSVNTMENDWNSFRSNFPYRTFWLLQAVINSNGNISYPLSRLKMPPSYLSDPYANGGIQVRRDNNNANFTSSWFDICNLNQVPTGTYVSLWIDISGSMVFNTVQASYNEFVADCAANGVNIILETSDSGERWIPGHNKTLPPSANFKIIDPQGNAVNSLTIAAGASVTLSWIVFGDATNLLITPNIINTTDINSFFGTAVVNPTQNTTYFLEATGPEGSTNLSVSVTVLTPPTITMIANPTDTIVNGGCTTIEWSTTGDADSLTWTQGNISNTNLTSNAQVCPGDTTTYCAQVSGIGGTSAITCVTINVSQPPTCSITSPANINYGNDIFDIEYETQYADASIEITPTYYNLDGTQSVGTTIVVNPATSSELGGTSGTTDRDGTIDYTTVGVPWNDFGPYLITWVIAVNGTGGSAQDSTNTSVIIDQTPDNFSIPESKDKVKEEEPVESPETTVLSELLLVDGIDIPVEIKANYPIQVDKNLEDDWKGVREI